MNDSSPIDVLHLFQPERNALLALLRDLDAEQWSAMTVCDGWTVKDVALHLLGDDISIVSRKRDNFQIPLPRAETFVDALNLHNATWIDAMRRLSPELLTDLLDHVGKQAIATFASLDLSAIGGPVTWTGPDPAPVWLDVAREYTERWHHQQHIRDAVERPSLMDKEFAGPVFETFVQALPWLNQERRWRALVADARWRELETQSARCRTCIQRRRIASGSRVEDVYERVADRNVCISSR